MNDTTERKEPLYRQIAGLLIAASNCRTEPLNPEWESRHTARMLRLVSEYMPSGSGIDSGTQLDTDRSTGEKLVFTTSFHHMHESGMYDGWTDHTVTVRPSLYFGLDISISGRNRNEIKDLLHEQFDIALRQELPINACAD